MKLWPTTVWHSILQPSKALRRKGVSAFTLVEVMVASAILALLMMAISQTIRQTSLVTRLSTNNISAFQRARLAFDTMTRRIGQTTLNSYWDYDDPNNPNYLKRYLRKSDLHFVIGSAGTSPLPGTPGTGSAVLMQTPADVFSNSAKHGGMSGLINACGYYIEYGRDSVPSVFQNAVKPVYRYRLMQAIQPTEDLGVYTSGAGDTTGAGWISTVSANAMPLADNIICLVVWPRKSPAEDANGDALTQNYTYNSRDKASDFPQPDTANQLPPLVQVTMITIDESSAARFCTGSTPPEALSQACSGLFSRSDQDTFNQDLDKLQTNLKSLHVTFRVYSALLPIRESKMQ